MNISGNAKQNIFGVIVSLLIFVVVGEVTLRIWFREGQSFNYGGPIHQRFNKDFVYNRFDKKSRGPEFSGPKMRGTTRLIVQGDSITWGQGVKSEKDLYTSRLQTLLRKDDPSTELAAIAMPDREIDYHLTQIAKWGEELDPDIIIYQFYVNDVLLDKKIRANTSHFVRHFFLYRFLVSRSYFIFFLDYSFHQRFPPKGNSSYSSRIAEHFEPDTEEWRRFASVFNAWAREAKRLTPNVLLVQYPYINASGKPALTKVYDKVAALCNGLDIEVLDLWPAFGDFQGDVKRIRASKYDMHPSAELHKRFAEHIYTKLLQF